jgi:hypothetical protein
VTFAAPGPVDEVDAADIPPSANPEADEYLHQLSEGWSAWIRTRRFYAPPSLPPSILGRLRARTPGTGKDGGPDAIASAELAAFNEAVEREPIEALDRQVFELHYRWRVRPVKTFAEALGISRPHWYRLLQSFERRVYASSREILERNDAARRGLRSTVGPV